MGKNEILGKNDYELFPHEVAESFLEEDKKIYGGQVIIQEDYLTNTSGEEGFYYTQKFPIYDNTKKMIAICGITTDITERNKAEELIKKQKEYKNS